MLELCLEYLEFLKILKYSNYDSNIHRTCLNGEPTSLNSEELTIFVYKTYIFIFYNVIVGHGIIVSSLNRELTLLVSSYSLRLILNSA